VKFKTEIKIIARSFSGIALVGSIIFFTLNDDVLGFLFFLLAAAAFFSASISVITQNTIGERGIFPILNHFVFRA
jgi:hypothetical protein